MNVLELEQSQRRTFYQLHSSTQLLVTINKNSNKNI